MKRTHCRCTVVRNYSYAEAAEKLKCHIRFLKDHISRLPHQKLGECRVFCECDLFVIQRIYGVMPDSVESLLTASAPTGAHLPAVPALASIAPSRGRKRAG